VIFFSYGSYRNAAMVGLAIMMDSRWNRPSPKYLYTRAGETYFTRPS
jgi:hypothetical protein